MDLNQIFAVVPLIISIAAVGASIYATVQSRKAVFSGAYFSNMVAAYADYLKSVAEFVYNRDNLHRDALSTALYRAILFASPDIAEYSQKLFLFVIDWSRSGMVRPLPVDEKVNELGNLMKNDIDHFRRFGHH